MGGVPCRARLRDRAPVPGAGLHPAAELFHRRIVQRQFGGARRHVAGEHQRLRLFAHLCAVQEKIPPHLRAGDLRGTSLARRGAALPPAVLHLQRLQRARARHQHPAELSEFQDRDPGRQRQRRIQGARGRLRGKIRRRSRPQGRPHGVQGGEPEQLPARQDGLRIFCDLRQRRDHPAGLYHAGAALFPLERAFRRGAGAPFGDGGRERVPAADGHGRALQREHGAGRQKFLRRERAHRARHGGEPRLL